MNKIKIAIIGAGVRGRYIYGDFIERNKDLYEIVAVVDNKIGRRQKFKEISSYIIGIHGDGGIEILNDRRIVDIRWVTGINDYSS